MVEVAGFITACATLISAVIWPALIGVTLFCFRKTLLATLTELPLLLSRAERAKLGWLEIELNKQVEEVGKNVDLGRGEVSPEQVRSAARVELVSRDLRVTDLRSQVERLSREYNALRATLKPGPDRTRAMDEIIAQMRTIGPASAFMLEELKSSLSAGNRLAAIAIMQMDLSKADLKWLLARFASEAPFLFYHAALVLEILVRNQIGDVTDVISTAKEALNILEEFEGVPDRNTIDVLRSIVEE
jgi:hypothetical protein